MEEPLKILKQYWGFDSFRVLQGDIVASVLASKDTLVLLPTGGGKSLCYQLPALCNEGLCIVVSPLIALMKDQVDQLRNKGIKAYAIYTGLTSREIDIILDNCIYGNVKLLYVSPERLQTEIFVERVKNMKVNLLAVDEAHCVSQWGYDFRPSYLEIANFKNDILPEIPTIALTATATKAVVEDIADKLGMQKPEIFQASFVRSNLSFAVRKVEDKDSKLISILKNVPGTACVYVRTRKRARDLSNLLLQNQISADYYHAGIGHDQRINKQELWQQGKIRVIVATNAFGMGIDKQDVRIVIHYDLPDTLEAYYQEAGRAGRDGNKAYAVLVFHEGDKDLANKFFESAQPSIDFVKRVYQALANYYKMAVGSNKLSFYDFDILDFCNNFNFHRSEVYYAIKKLQEEGFIELNESFYHPSKVTFNIEKADLYKFQIANEQYDPLIKTLLRIYGGEVLNSFVQISENQLARFINTTTYKVKTQLFHLSRIKVITYDAMRDKPQLSFITPRFDASKLPINQVRFRERRKIKEEKLKAMLRYVEAEHRCRTSIILEYFGEHSYEDCGFCDYCLEKKKKLNQSDHLRIEEMVRYELKKGPRLPEEITGLFSEKELIMVESIVREMTDTSELGYDDKGRLVWRD